MKERGADAPLAATVATVAAAYAYFLIFAEFAFVELVRPHAATGGLNGVMAALGAGGIAGGWVAARVYRAGSYGRALAAGFAGCVLGAAGALTMPAMPPVLVAGWTGLAMGGLAVTLAAGLRGAVGVVRLGRVVGAGTGLAYAVCNLPWLFTATPRVQTMAAMAMALVGLAASWTLRSSTVEPETRADFSRRGLAVWTAVFLALVWMDSAAFFIIRHSDSLRERTWEGVWPLLGNAGAHLLVAIVTGWLLDRGWLGRLGLAAWVALAASCLALRAAVGGSIELLYVAGVSVYSVALVYYPARSGRPWVAALVFAVAGWAGSALGIGMAQDLAEVPAWFAPASGAWVLGALAVRAWFSRRGR